MLVSWFPAEFHQRGLIGVRSGIFPRTGCQPFPSTNQPLNKRHPPKWGFFLTVTRRSRCPERTSRRFRAERPAQGPPTAAASPDAREEAREGALCARASSERITRARHPPCFSVLRFSPLRSCEFEAEPISNSSARFAALSQSPANSDRGGRENRHCGL